MQKAIAKTGYVIWGEFNGTPLWRYECWIDPNAPSIEEVVEGLKVARKSIIGWVDDGRGVDASDFVEVTQIDNLIYRLEEQ